MKVRILLIICPQVLMQNCMQSLIHITTLRNKGTFLHDFPVVLKIKNTISYCGKVFIFSSLVIQFICGKVRGSVMESIRFSIYIGEIIVTTE